MMPMTTSNSTSVKPGRGRFFSLRCFSGERKTGTGTVFSLQLQLMPVYVSDAQKGGQKLHSEIKAERRVYEGRGADPDLREIAQTPALAVFSERSHTSRCQAVELCTPLIRGINGFRHMLGFHMPVEVEEVGFA
jgi:hypothetical protein